MARRASDQDQYLARIVKLIPSEVIAAYLAIGNLINRVACRTLEKHGIVVQPILFLTGDAVRPSGNEHGRLEKE
jgi:hypothetical protein